MSTEQRYNVQPSLDIEFQRGDVAVGIANLRPLRKSICLIVQDTPGRGTVAAYFRSEQHALAFVEAMRVLLGKPTR